MDATPEPPITDSPFPPEVMADMQRAVELARAGRRDLEFEKRVRTLARRVRDEVYQAHGLLDIGTPAIRELRDRE